MPLGLIPDADKLVNLETALAIALASIPALLTVLWSMWQHNKRVDDTKEILRAEIGQCSSDVQKVVHTVQVEIEAVAKQLTNVEAELAAARTGISSLQEVPIRLSGLEADLKRSLAGLDALNSRAIQAAEVSTEHRVKLDALSQHKEHQKFSQDELKERVAGLANKLDSVADMQTKLDDVAEATSNLDEIVDSAIEPFAKRLNDIEKSYRESIHSAIERILKRLDDTEEEGDGGRPPN